MGNCIQSAETWVEDDEERESEEAVSPRLYSSEEEAGGMAGDEMRLLEDKGGLPSTEVKIKISKKQLEALLQQANIKGLPIQQVLNDLLRLGEVGLQDDDRRWRPTLQSIPEVSEESQRR